MWTVATGDAKRHKETQSDSKGVSCNRIAAAEAETFAPASQFPATPDDPLVIQQKVVTSSLDEASAP